MRNAGNCCFSARIGLVSNKQSPIDRSRIRRMRAFDERLLNSSLVFNFCFADQHHGDVVANRIYAAALATLQCLSAFGQIDRGLTNWTDEDLQEFRVDGLRGEKFKQETRNQRVLGLWNWEFGIQGTGIVV